MPKTVARGDRSLLSALGAATIATMALVSGCTAVGHDGTAAAAAADGRPTVLATFTVIADIARVVAGDDVRVESLTREGVQIHDYEPTPDDLVRASDADLVIANGLGVDAWLEAQLQLGDTPSITLGDAIEPIPIEAGHHAGEANPHAWMSPVTGAVYVEEVRVALTELDPEHADGFAARAAALTAQLTAIGDRLSAAVAQLPPEHRILVTCEAAFSYLARDADLDEASLWPVNAAGQGTPQAIAAALDTVRERQVPTVFCESTTHPGTQQQIAAVSGAAFDGSLYVDSLSGPDGWAPTYVALLEHDVDVIIDGLSA